MANNGFDEWGGYMGAKITKLEEQFTAASDPFRQSNLFAGISIFVNGLTNPSADELKRLMMQHGGIFHHYERAHTTYIIASNLPDVKVRKMNTSKIITAQWVVDCLREKRIIDYTNYLLYTAQKTTQPRLTFGKGKKEETQATKEQVAAIMRDLEQLNAKMRESLAATTAQELKEVKFEPAVEPSVEQKPMNASVSVNTSSSSSTSVARTAVDPKFLSEFYNNSRLHHIATLGAGFKQYVSDLREKHDANLGFPARKQLKQKLRAQGVAPFIGNLGAAYVMHIDMDCFFVSVGLRKHPHLRGQPVAVTHSKGGAAATEVPVHPAADREVEMELFAHRFEHHLHSNVLSDKVRNGFDAKMSLSEIASCSYEARAKGLRNGMFVGHAMKLCPDLKTIPYDFEGYREVAFTLYDTIAQYTLNIEAVSCDEMFVDLAEVLKELQLRPMDFVQAIREEVRQKTGCPCSAGVGANKLQARMATKHAKPDGQYHLAATDVELYMCDIPIRELPGVGSSTAYTLQEAQLLKCGDLQKVSLAKLQMLVGKKFGETLHQSCRGIDNRGLTYGQLRKSVSAEVNYGIRFTAYAELETFLRQLCTEVHTRLSDIKRKTKCVTLKVMIRAKDAPVEASKFMGHGVCDNITKSVSLSEFTSDLEAITRTILTTMKALALPPNELRGIGIQLSKLDDPNECKEKKENVIKNMFSKVAEKQKETKPEVNTISTLRKEPVNVELKETITALNEIKEPAISKQIPKKTRGRPAGAVTKNTKKRTNVMGMLKNAALAKEVANEVANSKVLSGNIPSDIDPEVFAALPQDIRVEILRERALLEVPSKPTPKTANISALNESDLLPSTSKAAQVKRTRKQQLKTQQKQKQQTPQPLQVDAEFLAAMPPELRAEIEMQIKAQQQTVADQSYHPLTQTADMKATNKMNKQQAADACTVEINTDNIFVQENWLALLLAWVKSGEVPENYDVELISENARELVHAKELEKLYDPLLYLCRLLNSRKGSAADCAWHLAYRMILRTVQTEMHEFYDGRKLYLGAQLKCDRCEEQ